MNRTKLHWLDDGGIPPGCTFLEAVPGVGNVGKIVIDGLVKKHPSRTLCWVLHPDFPPHASLDDDGLIRPPRLEVKSVLLPNGSTVITISGLMQPMTAAGQFEVSEAILELAAESSSERLLVLAGLSAEPEERGIHVICSDSKYRAQLEAEDITVSREKPNSGGIGIAGMVLSLAPIQGVRTAGIIAETMGASCDVMAANRMANWIEHAFEIPLDLDLDTTEETAARLMEAIDPMGTIEDLIGSEESEVSTDFYV